VPKRFDPETADILDRLRWHAERVRSAESERNRLIKEAREKSPPISYTDLEEATGFTRKGLWKIVNR
jgi:hypothetical protein